MFRQLLANTLLRLLGAALVVALVVYLLILRNMYYEPTSASRSAVGHNWTMAGFSVAIVWPPHGDLSLVEGVTLAFEELNARGGPLANKIRLRFYTEREDNGALARQIARIPDVLAVIGHELEENTIPASVAYQEHGILFISPKSTNLRLTTHGFNFVFRITPNDTVMTRNMAKFATQQNWKRVGILYGQHEHGVTASGLFLSNIRASGVQIPFFRSYLAAEDWVSQDHRPLVAEIRKETFDAVMMADTLPSAAKMLVDMARMGVTQPVLATDKLDSLQVWQIAQIAANNLYVASSVDPEAKYPAYVDFRARFQKRFGMNPGYGASQGFEAFNLFAKACELSQSADPIVVSTTIRTGKWQVLFDEFAFEEDGDIVGRDISIKKMRDGRFSTVQTMQEDIP